MSNQILLAAFLTLSGNIKAQREKGGKKDKSGLGSRIYIY